jgi:type IV pilus assembly protein PilN
VILINLLPHRALKRAQRKRAFFVGLGGSFVGGLLLAAIWHTTLLQLTAAQNARNELLKAEIGQLDAQIKDIATLRQEIEALKARQRAVEDLQTDRNVPVHLLNELTRQTPEGVVLTALHQQGQTVAIRGYAQTNERVSELLRNTFYHSPWLEKPELVEIKAATPGTGREPRRLFEFQLRLTLKRAQPAAPAALKPAAPPVRAS